MQVCYSLVRDLPGVLRALGDSHVDGQAALAVQGSRVFVLGTSFDLDLQQEGHSKSCANQQSRAIDSHMITYHGARERLTRVLCLTDHRLGCTFK